jgi:NAD(P)-dependent dehydrogenase (short-subunit alcohol dehydrogenase family)
MSLRTTTPAPTAIVTGASRGLGRALSRSLAADGWRLVVDARDAEALHAAAAELDRAGADDVVAVAGDVRSPEHRAALVRSAGARVDLLVNNASLLGPSPLPALSELDGDAFADLLDANVRAPLHLVQAALPALRAATGTIVSISSDAAVGPYEGWGAYGASKAALDQWTAVLGVEEPDLAVYAFDPGDMRTRMHQAAYPGEDISDRPEPESVVPALRRLVETRPASGRYRVGDRLLAGAAA